MKAFGGTWAGHSAFFFLFLLGYKHPEEVNLHKRMTSFPLFLNNAPSHQQEAYPARLSGLREWKVLEAWTAAQAFPPLRSAPTPPADTQPRTPLPP